MIHAQNAIQTLFDQNMKHSSKLYPSPTKIEWRAYVKTRQLYIDIQFKENPPVSSFPGTRQEWVEFDQLV